MGRESSRNRFWLRSAAWDSFWMLSGIWLLGPLWFFRDAPAAQKSVLIVATLVLWLSHRFATTYNAFCTPAYRGLIREQRTRFLIWPMAIILATFGFVFAPSSMFPLSGWTKIQILGSIFFLYNSYHFGIQHYGVLSIYRIRASQDHTRWLKSYEKFFCVAVGTISVAIAQICQGAEVVQDSIVYNVVPRDAFSSAFSVLKVVAPILVSVLAAVFYVGEFTSKRVSLPKVLYVAGLTLQGILAYFLEPISFLLLWGVQHWLVSVALGAHMAQNDKGAIPDASLWYGFWDRFNKGFWPTVCILAFVSAVLTPFFQFAVHPEKLTKDPTIFSVLLPVLANTVLANIFIAFNFASVYIHFVMDRAVFRFSDPAVRRVSVPLLLNAGFAGR